MPMGEPMFSFARFICVSFRKKEDMKSLSAISFPNKVLAALLLIGFLCFSPAAMAYPGIDDSRILAYSCALLKAGRYEECISRLNSIIYASSNKELWQYLGAAYFKKGNLLRAEKAFISGLNIDQKYWCCWAGLGEVYYEQGRYDESQQAFAKARALKERSSETQRQVSYLEPGGIPIPNYFTASVKESSEIPDQTNRTATNRIAQNAAPDRNGPEKEALVPHTAGGHAWRVKSNLPTAKESLF